MAKLIRSDFTSTNIPTAFDLRDELIKLNKTARRASAEVARQIEEYVDAVYDTVKTDTLVGTPPDGTTAATANLKATYSDFVDFARAERIKIGRAIKLGAEDVKTDIAQQLQDFLEARLWTFDSDA